MNWLRKFWCDLTHGGGDITRDDQGRINWRCRKCGRWSDYPVSHEDARAAIDREIAQHKSAT